MTGVFLVDDHEIVRAGLAQLVNAAPDLHVVGEAGTVRDALRRISATTPDVALLDMRLPDGDGIELCRDIRSLLPSTACVILTAHDDDAALRSAALAGASGYILKEVRAGAILDAVRHAARGGTLQSAETRQKAADALRPTAQTSDEMDDLTYRERQVLELIADGLTNREIGERLGLAEKTVKNYVSGLLAKLGMSRRTQAAVFGAANRKPST